MNRTSRLTRLVATLVSLSFMAACARHDHKAVANAEFCHTMKQVTAQLDPGTGSQTPAANKARYEQLATLLAHAQTISPASLTNDVSTFQSAIGNFATALAAVNYDLDALFKTPTGIKQADDASHAMTPAVVDYMTGPCGLTFGPK
jgi:hypothetical protein